MNPQQQPLDSAERAWTDRRWVSALNVDTRQRGSLQTEAGPQACTAVTGREALSLVHQALGMLGLSD